MRHSTKIGIFWQVEISAQLKVLRNHALQPVTSNNIFVSRTLPVDALHLPRRTSQAPAISSSSPPAG
jgi:hypothetical protein